MSVILRPEEITQRYGRLFCKGFYTLVDEKAGVAQIIEECSAKGPVEWDAVNRRRARGAVEKIRVEGTTIIMDAILGEREVNFGPATKETGGQGLKAVRVEGDVVKTTWVGLAGASVGIGACMPQGPGTICAEYPDDAKIGGAHRLEVTVTSPKLVRVVIAVDDTDTKEKGATWAMVLKVARECPHGHLLEHKIIQLNPNVPEKTTNCSSTAVSFAIKEEDAPALIEYFVNAIKRETFSKNSTIVVYQGLKIPQPLVDYGLRAKREILTVDIARTAAREGHASIIEVTGPRGTIGAVAGLGCFDLGLKAAALPEDEV
jgi:methanogenesis imperfect marker protein 11